MLRQTSLLTLATVLLAAVALDAGPLRTAARASGRATVTAAKAVGKAGVVSAKAVTKVAKKAY